MEEQVGGGLFASTTQANTNTITVPPPPCRPFFACNAKQEGAEGYVLAPLTHILLPSPTPPPSYRRATAVITASPPSQLAASSWRVGRAGLMGGAVAPSYHQHMALTLPWLNPLAMSLTSSPRPALLPTPPLLEPPTPLLPLTTPMVTTLTPLTSVASSDAPHIPLINAAAFARACKLPGTQSFTVHLSNSDISAHAASISNEAPDLSSIPPEYHDFADVFSKSKADMLAPHQPL
ncbi:hypothetical protein CPB84DRAFT_1855323 [Gymnopilus junonius]|uniref:Uncharacterized protein n=1 Tax=Gymnopilus junonius TaxID=109634 RepID=A0A9P5N8G8_GYMJU|nr:hypothetical protein CPB84DRAFT_1855323 [Gymnopilus junonius]